MGSRTTTWSAGSTLGVAHNRGDRGYNGRLEAHVSQAIEPKPDRDGATLILDIDAYRQAELLLEEDDVEARIEETLGELHEFKNEIFFASLSETMIEGFE